MAIISKGGQEKGMGDRGLGGDLSQFDIDNWRNENGSPLSMEQKERIKIAIKKNGLATVFTNNEGEVTMEMVYPSSHNSPSTEQ